MDGVAQLDVVQQRLGLGCSRLGSVLGRDRVDAFHLIRSALDQGIRFFDTANIYGQGESESILGAALQSCRKSVTIVTKAGQYFPAWMMVARPFKRVISPLIRRSGAGSYVISKARAAPLPQRFSDRFLHASIEASLRRLKTDYADIFLLHSPPARVIADGYAIGVLEKIRGAGKAVKIGISCEDIESGLLALNDPRVKAIELPLWPATDASQRFLDHARCRGVLVIGRGLMGTTSPADNTERWLSARAALLASLQRSEISRVLVGTNRVSHLCQFVEAARNMESAPCS